MKKTIISAFTLIVSVIGLSNLTYADTVHSNYVTTLTNVNTINKIEVHGNVELFISDATTDQVKVYNKYYSESALVQNKNGVLNIASYSNEKLVVWVSANDLRSVSAYDNAEIKSFGEISGIEFNVELHDNASANLNLNAFDAKVSVNDYAKANLSGSANNYSLSHNFSSSVNSVNLKTVHITENKVNFPDTIDDQAGI